MEQRVVIKCSNLVNSLCFSWVLFNWIQNATANVESDALNAFRKAMVDPSQNLGSWEMYLTDPCTWSHIHCNDNRSVDEINLQNTNLSGQLVPELGQLQNLERLELYGNNLSGIIPPELGNLANLKYLDLYMNNLSGPIPETLGKLEQLQTLRLSNNKLSGEIPRSLTTIKTLIILDLSYNQLNGTFPVNGSFSQFTPMSFEGDLNLTMPAVPPHPYIQSPSSSPGKNTNKAIVGGAAGGIAVALATFAIAFGLWRRRKHQDHFFDVPEEDLEVNLEQLKRFSLRELQAATDSFSHENILGSGGFGKVYKGRLADGSLVAVKRLREERTQGGELQFQTELEMISMAVHRNLLGLRGFCMTPTERLLVYPFMVNGSLASCLRGRPESQPPLTWDTRQRIALGSARGLAYLHDHCDPKIIHRDIKAANILLDEEYEAVIGDFGLARLMNYKDTHVITVVRGTIGHIPPEYLSSGTSSEKTDVFGYGIMLLELVTGQMAFNLAQLANDDSVMLLDWVKGLLQERKVETLVDADLQASCAVAEVEKLLQIALLCTQHSPVDRPKMSEVVRMLEGDDVAEKWEEWQKEDLIRDEFNRVQILHANWMIADSTSDLQPDELSGPR